MASLLFVYDHCNVDLLSCRADNGSSSEYSFKIDKNKENQTVKKKKRVHVFQTWKKQLSESVRLRLIDLKKYITKKKNNHLINNNINENSNNKKTNKSSL